MTAYEIIKKKRDGKEISYNELKFLIDGFTSGTIPDYQMSAFLMAVFFVGMNDEETYQLTKVMVESGVTVDLSNIPGIKVDKHSSGGVADTVTLVVAPLVAAGGVPVAKMSGRGLGHTGGTIDKLESIPGFKTTLSKDEFEKAVINSGISVIAQSQNLVLADKLMYALRDVTATVDSIPLIASSIMSKKIASGADAILLDVKTGSGAFMKNAEEAHKLAELMVSIGRKAGKKMMAFVTDMNQPLGNAVGNALEVKEAIEVLQGNGPDDLTALCLKIAGGMLWLGEKANSLEEGEQLAKKIISSGRALEKMQEFIANQGGNSAICKDTSLLPQALYMETFNATKDGYLIYCDTEQIGLAALKLGAGRIRKEEIIDYSAGLVLKKRIGDKISAGEPLCELFTSDINKFMAAKENLNTAFRIEEKIPPTLKLIHSIVV